MLNQHPSTALDTAQAAVAIQAARSEARYLSRRLNAQSADEQDIQQAILLDLIARSVRFDIGRGSWRSFVANVTRNAAGRIAQKHINHDRATADFATADDCPDETTTVRSTHIDMDLKRAIRRLPKHLQDLLHRVAECGGVAPARRATHASTASFYRDLNELRLVLLAEGASLEAVTQFEKKRAHRSGV